MRVKDMLQKYGVRADKGLGQNFLCDDIAVEKIVAAADPCGEDFILEIGPGLGALSKPLSALAGGFAAVELDRTLAGILEKELAGEIICGDFLKLDLSRFNKHTSLKIAGSLPYYITTPCIRKILNSGALIKSAVLVVQKEVADKLAAKPGDAGYGVLSLRAAYFGTITNVCELPPSSFYPQPAVHSRAVKLTAHEAPVAESGRDALFRVIEAAFATRRKTLVNCLVQNLGIPREIAAECIKKCGFAVEARGEELEIAQFDCLAKEIARFC